MKKFLFLAVLVSISGMANAQSLSASLSNKMDYLIARQNIVSANIANASTPDYLANDIKYSASSKPMGVMMPIRATNSKHLRSAGIAKSKFRRTQDKTFIRNDGNSVRIDEQMLKMAEIQQEYTMATRLFAKHMAMQKMAVQAK
ncbi:MAG TPA: flagellar basal body rod protein FlgB [Alphaproteobacteria bacterium]|nr:flagellar basal body rod protein FlgB [Alphaproteobacteria bacterium]